MSEIPVLVCSTSVVPGADGVVRQISK